MKQFTVTSPTNALAVVIYIVFAFYGLMLTINLADPPSLVGAFGNALRDVWAVTLFLSSSAAVYATLSAPKRRDPDRSLVLELIASVALCTLMGFFAWSFIDYWHETFVFPVSPFGLVLIFLLGFGSRAIQIVVERRSLRNFRNGPPPIDTNLA